MILDSICRCEKLQYSIYEPFPAGQSLRSLLDIILLGLAVCILPCGVEKPSTLPSFYRFILSSENLS